MKWILSLFTLSLAFSMTACGAAPNPPKDYDTIYDVADPVGQEVDDLFPSHRELTKPRTEGDHTVDSCEPALGDRGTFADRIAFAVEEGIRNKKAQLAYVSSAFKLPRNQEDFMESGLIKNWFCPVTSASLKDTLRKNIPNAATIEKANNFAIRMNELRRAALGGDTQALLAAHRLWSKFMMCLAYTESLTTADTQSSRSVAEKYDFPKSEGVKFYYDRAQSNPKSRFNIGLFQFSPDSGGNVHACLRAWNLRFPACQQSTGSPMRDLGLTLSSSRQTFNAFCGVTKITDMFGVQVNTTSSTNTHPANRMGDGRLLPPDIRCVTPFFRTGASYNHFGPLQNSTGRNMASLMSCVMAE